jgi:competence ComEA-like helix-hairpin-helix protein
MGQSRLERFYAFVQTKDGDLGEQLVRNGLARIYGFKAVPPSLQNSRQEIQKLQQLEDEAKQERIGGWGINVGRLNTRAQGPAVFSFFALPNRTQRPPVLPHLPFSRLSPTPIPSTSPRRTPASHPKEKTPLGKIDINTATEKELTTVPGIGHVMAARIIAARPFRSADDLKRVSGIGDKKYEQIRPYFQ